MRQLKRLISESLMLEGAMNSQYESKLKSGLQNVIDKNEGRDEPNIILPYRYGRNSPSHDAVVEALQAFLKDAGHYTMKLDGDWGRGTDAALKAFQKANLSAAEYEDGKLGPKTSNVILNKIGRSKIKGRTVEDSLYTFLTGDSATVAEKRAYLKLFRLDPKVKAAAEALINQLEISERDKAFLKKLKYDADKAAVDKFTDDLDFDGTGSKNDKREAYKAAIKIPITFSSAVQKMYKNNPNNPKDTSQAISIGIRNLSKEQVAKIDIDNVKLKGLGIGGKKRLYIPMKDGTYYEYVLDNKGARAKLDRRKSKPHTIQQFMKEGNYRRSNRLF